MATFLIITALLMLAPMILSLGLMLSDAFGHGNQTQSAGTKINQMAQGKLGMYTYVTRLTYKAGATEHTLNLMKRIAETTLTAAAAAGQAVINIAADPGSIAANDHLAIKKPDGTWHHGIVSSVATLAITLTANVPTGAFASGARVIFYGAPADTDHDPFEYEGTASVTTTYPKVGEGTLIKSATTDEPIIFSSDNLTNAGELMEFSGGYSRGAV